MLKRHWLLAKVQWVLKSSMNCLILGDIQIVRDKSTFMIMSRISSSPNSTETPMAVPVPINQRIKIEKTQSDI